MGSFDEAFLAIPEEVIRATIRNNQKCFVVRNGKTGKLANKFILTANIEASDGGKAIVAGNGRVIRARLSDARHFWETDRKPLPAYRDTDLKPLDQRLAKLRDQNIVFHDKLGTQGERIERIARLAREIAPLVGADPDKAARAANLAKADLVTEMVGEFPELQGLMGRYYAAAQGEDPSVAAAIEDHYKPVGPSDRVPSDPVAIAVALADKLDTLVGFWAIDEKPTGSKDPYALRRAALGMIRIVLENKVRLVLWPAFVVLGRRAMAQLLKGAVGQMRTRMAMFEATGDINPQGLLSQLASLSEKASGLMLGDDHLSVPVQDWERASADNLLAFFADRLKVQLREQGARHDLVDAVFALGGQDDLLLIVRRVEALGKFLDSDDGKNLLAGYKRATNILRDEEKKSGEKYDGTFLPSLFREVEEKALGSAVSSTLTEAAIAVAAEDFSAAMSALARLRAPVDAFFDKVRVNDPDPAVRANRLRLLNRIREATLAVADFSKVGG